MRAFLGIASLVTAGAAGAAAVVARRPRQAEGAIPAPSHGMEHDAVQAIDAARARLRAAAADAPGARAA